MKVLTSILRVSVLLVFLVSCSADDETSVVEGAWKLTSWSVGISVDFNNDGMASLNLLEEIPCENNEVLVFNNQGVVESNNTFHSEIKIALTDEVFNEYQCSVVCSEGVIGTVGAYSVSGNNVVIDNTLATFDENKLIRVFSDAIKIYNEDYTEVMFLKDLKLEYSKM